MHPLDAADPLRPLRARFAHDSSGLIYLDGNSLGRLPLLAAERAAELVRREWGERLIRGWNEGWFELPERIGAKLARLLGARLGTVIVADSTSVNLFKLAVAALRARPGRSRILTDDLNFPSDLYILQGVAALLGGNGAPGGAPGHTLERIPSPDGFHGPVEEILAALDERVALVCLSHTVFKSAYTYDLAAITSAARAAGALVLWDLSHSAGAVPIDLDGAGVDLAVGCTYKYLNGGPGAPAFLYVREELQESLQNPISGWMGQRNLFAFEPEYAPADGLRRFLSGTPSVLALAAMEPGIDLLLEAGMERVRAKSVQQSELLIALWEEKLAQLGYRLNSPRDAALRGSHISLGHDEGWRIDQALIHQMNVLPDFRRPDNIRLGIAPLYNSFADIVAAVDALEQIVVERLYEQYPADAPTVT